MSTNSNEQCPPADLAEEGQQFHQTIRREAVERLAAIGKKTVAELVENTLQFARKYPGAALLAAAAAGFLVGRGFGRRD